MLGAGCLLLTVVCVHAQTTAEEVRERAVVIAQGDSIIIRKGKGDMRIKLYEQRCESGIQKEEEIYEGVYLERVPADSRSFLDALPFIPQKKRLDKYVPHISGLFIGFSRLSDKCMGFKVSSKAHQDLSGSWEIGLNLLAAHQNFRRNPNWGVNIGLSWGYRAFSIDGDYALLEENGSSFFQDGSGMIPEGMDDSTPYYNDSRMRYFFFRVPLQLEWQQRWNTDLIFFNFGPEFEIRHGVRSFSHIYGGKKQTVAKGLYVRPVGVNLLLQAGYGNWGIYLRYSMNSLFQTGKGPDLFPYSFGLAWYW